MGCVARRRSVAAAPRPSQVQIAGRNREIIARRTHETGPPMTRNPQLDEAVAVFRDLGWAQTGEAVVQGARRGDHQR